MKNTFDLELDFDNECFKNYFLNEESGESIRFLPSTNNINILIGSNNSGKSRFLRSLMNQDNLSFINNSKLFLSLINKYNLLIEGFGNTFQISSVPINYLIQTFSKEKIENELKFNQNEKFKLHEVDLTKSLVEIVDFLNNSFFLVNKIGVIFSGANSLLGAARSNFISGLRFNNNSNLRNYEFKDLEFYFRDIQDIVNEIKKVVDSYKINSGNRIYIPTLRTAHSLFEFKGLSDSQEKFGKTKKIRQDIYQDTVRKNYPSLTDDIEIFTGLSLYNEIVNVRNSRKEKRNRFHAFEKFLKDNFFNGKDIDIIANFNIHRKDDGIEDEDLIEIFIGDNTKSLHNLGDGVQALIILMYKIFLADKDSMIFIDEPEINLHPGYQRLFLEQITNNKTLISKNLAYIIVSHSNHFLDLTLEKDNVSLYSFKSLGQDKFLIRNVNAGDNSILRDLGVNNSSVFLANSSIWVEGISDRNLIKAFLLAYCEGKKKPKHREDIDFAFFEYAGSNLVHYDFDKRKNEYETIEGLINAYALNNRVMLISDLDSGKEAKHKNIEEIAAELDGFEYKTTKPYREVENLLTNNVWKEILLAFCNKNEIKGNEENVQIRINFALKKYDAKDYKNEYVGEFLSIIKKEVSELNKIYKESDGNVPGTLTPKTELSQLVLSKVRDGKITWEDFSENQTIVDLTESVYKFIEKSKN